MKENEKNIKKEQKDLKNKNFKNEKSDRPIKNSDVFIKNSAKILILLLQEEKWTTSKLSRSIGLSFIQVNKLIRVLENLKYVISEKNKKFRFVSLTEKGKIISEKLNELRKQIDEEEIQK